MACKAANAFLQRLKKGNILITTYTPTPGLSNHTQEIQAIIDAMALTGGVVYVEGKAKLINGLTVPKNVTLKGAGGDTGHFSNTGDFSSAPGCLFVPSSATISLEDSATIENLTIIRDGLTLPFNSAAEASAGLAAFSGVAITVNGHDCAIRGCLILGFNTAIKSAGKERPNIDNVKIDCTNGVDISNCLDIARISNTHVWPFCTAHRPWVTSHLLTRSGFAFCVHTRCDWAKFYGCFSYGWFRGFIVANTDAVQFISCSADGPAGADGRALQQHSIGFLIDDSSTDTSMVGCRSTNKMHGFYFNMGSPTRFATMTACDIASAVNAIVMISGSASHASGVVRSCTNGYLLNNGHSRLNVEPSVFVSGLSGVLLNNPSGNGFHRFSPTTV